ncbi:MAG TPA: acetaldehyde dehydrogenase (acetylating) [Acidimicrobiales bacterium]|nr:acetaldehyde dehydrogenase (acetylating) [Acidimicrobiales bacterium]
MTKPVAAIVGSGNIGTDLMEKLLRSEALQLAYMVGVDPASEGLRRADRRGLEVSPEGVDWLLAREQLPDIVFEATSAHVHAANAPRYQEAGIRAVDLTPAAIGPFVVPPVNLHEHLGAPNLNMVTCGGQATIPMVHAVARTTPVPYAEIVATIASRSAGPGTRANIDEFTITTSRAIASVGGAGLGKAIIILNPADPPLIMRDTIFCEIGPEADRDAITASVREMERAVGTYVPGYRLLRDPAFLDDRVVIQVEVRGAGDYLPPYAGNLDIMTSAAAKVGEELAIAATAGVS